MNKYIITPIKSLLHERAFLVCVGLMAFGAGGLHLMAGLLGMHMVKEAIGLQRSLDELPESVIKPEFRVLGKKKIDNKDILSELGTDDYIQWLVECTDKQIPHALSSFNLFITYYNRPDLVPHIPEVCYVAGGSRINKGQHTEVTITLPDGQKQTVPVRVLSMSSPMNLTGSTDTLVCYFFSVNGRLVADRNDVRFLLRNPFDRYAYFSKVEVTFFGNNPDENMALEILQQLAQKMVPVLEKDYWPEWPPDKGK